MEERSKMDNYDEVDDVILPGFRFRPTDQELIGFYLKKKIQQKSLPIELIKQVDIYNYEPWDLPKLASTSSEKEWYFYCPRERKYKNSSRPNRVITRNNGKSIGYWKATGTDKAIYSSDGKCIGLKKSLVFYKGRASNGNKTDWMMHEFRLPCISNSTSPKKLFDKSFSPNDSWAICKIFEKPTSSSMVQKALSHPWISQLPGGRVSELLTQTSNTNQLCSQSNISLSTKTEQESSTIKFCSNNTNNFSPSYFPNYTISKSSQIPNGDNVVHNNIMLYNTTEATDSTKCPIDTSSIISNTNYIGLEDANNQYSNFSINLPKDIQPNIGTELEEQDWKKNPYYWETIGRTIEFPFNLSPNYDALRENFTWDSLPCTSEMSTNYVTSVAKCYT
ncbi:uncharacterized protein NAC12 isoform X2 [Cicer arietinum]|uniref:NAC domain-containing protein 94 isoform X2 n=1 Tax=Cicer arietinum TaxID=3827 RepID=A0A1S2XK86_CICAR|nr:putative NAC domain-containing protein 94 isoform X2 [Cicer arietinum]